MSVAVPLTHGKVAIIDEQDAERVLRYNWFVMGDRNIYAAADIQNPDGKHELWMLHRFILQPPLGVQVDHRDGDGLNNCRSNLRLASRNQNTQNLRRPKNNKSGFKGVSWSAGQRKRVRHSIRIDTFGKFRQDFLQQAKESE